MSGTIKFEDLKDRIIELRSEMVLLDADVANLYGVETKRINEAVKNNPDKFPAGYLIELEKNERYRDIHRAELCGFEVQAYDKEEKKMTEVI